MSTIDIILILIVIAGAIRGAQLGFIRQLSTIFAFVLGIIGSKIFSGSIKEFVLFAIPNIKTLPSPDMVTSVLSHILCFVIIYLIVRITGSFIRSIFRSLNIGFLDRILGIAIGVFKYLFGMSLVLNLILFVSPKSPLFSSGTLLKGKALELVVDIVPFVLDMKIMDLASNTYKMATT